MWVARDKDGRLKLFPDKPVRNESFEDDDCNERVNKWMRDAEKFLPVHYASHDSLYNPHYQIMRLDESLFPELTWDDEPMEVTILPISNLRHYITDKISEGIKKGLVKACKYGKGIN